MHGPLLCCEKQVLKCLSLCCISSVRVNSLKLSWWNLSLCKVLSLPVTPTLAFNINVLAAMTLVMLGGTTASTGLDKLVTVLVTASGGPKTAVEVHVAVSKCVTGSHVTVTPS